MRAVGTFINKTFVFQYNGMILTFQHSLIIEDLKKALIDTCKFMVKSIYDKNKYKIINNDEFIYLLSDFIITNNTENINVRIFNSYNEIIKNNCFVCLFFPSYKKSLISLRNYPSVMNYTVRLQEDTIDTS